MIGSAQQWSQQKELTELDKVVGVQTFEHR